MLSVDVEGALLLWALESDGLMLDQGLNLTHLALAMSRYVNGVSRRHGQVSQGMSTSS